MDYLEGFLVGPVWSDTDYRTRRHFNAHVLLAAFMAAVFVLLTLFPHYYQKLVRVDWPLSWILLLVLTLLTPALSILYRRLPLYVRPLLLIIYAAKYLLLFYVLVQYFLPLVTFEKESVLALLYERVDEHIGTALEVIAESGGILVTVAGVVAGGLWVLGEGLLIVVVLVLVPLLAITLYKLLQYGLDRLVKGILDRQLDGIDYYVPLTPPEPDLTPQSPDRLPEDLLFPSPPPEEVMRPAPRPSPLPPEDRLPVPVTRSQEIVREPARRIPLKDKLPKEKVAPPKERVRKKTSLDERMRVVKGKTKDLLFRSGRQAKRAGLAIKGWSLAFWALLVKTARRSKEGIARLFDRGKKEKDKRHDMRQVKIKTLPRDPEDTSDTEEP